MARGPFGPKRRGSLHTKRHIRAVTLGIAVVTALLWAFPAAIGAGRSATVVKVIAGQPTEFGYVVSPKSVTHGPVTFSVTNAGTRSHSFSIKGKRVVVAPGQTTRLRVTLPAAGNYFYFCTLAGHAAAGMKGALKVT